MRKPLFLAFTLFPILLFGQVNLKEIRKEGHMVYAYKIAAAEAEKDIRMDSIDIDAFLAKTPAAVFPSDSVDEKKLALGHYVLMSVQDNRIVANLIDVSDLAVYPVNNQQHVQLLIVDKNGDFIDNAKIRINGREAVYRSASRSYWVKQKNPGGALVSVYTPHDTLFSSLSARDVQDRSVARQRWDNLNRTGLVRSIRWLSGRLKSLFREKRSYRSVSIGASGMMVFNQPKYKQTDTVKGKAYVFNRKWRPYKRAVNIFLEYYSAGKNNRTFIRKLEPASPGSFVFQFPLSDTLQADLDYTVDFRTDDNKRVLSKSFRIEDYLLDEIAAYSLRSEKDTYYAGDTMHFYASATNTNGQSLLDGTVKLVLTTENIERFSKDSLYIPDTLFVQSKPLASEGETIFDFPTLSLPEARLDIKATMELKNSNNELQEKEVLINYRPGEKEFTAFVDKDSVGASYKENGKIIPAEGTVHLSDDWDETLKIHYPFKMKLTGLVDAYQFYLQKNGKMTDSAKAELAERYELPLERISHGDTLGFVLDNPYTLPVSFTVFDGNKIIGVGKSSDKQIRWMSANNNKKHAYRVYWQYYWNGEEKSAEQSIALLYKLLKIEVRSNESVFPGQRDTISVNVRDYKNNPVSGVNLTAVAYNSQFSKDIHVPDPPYLVKYKSRSRIKRDKFDTEDGYILKRYRLGLHPAWIERFGLDTLLYYTMLFPKKGMIDVVTPIDEFIPQVSVHVVEKGERKEIYLLYINRSLTYFNGVTDKMRDAYQTYPGYAQIGIRLYNRFIQIDSIYIQPSYKHDLFFDIDHLPANAKITRLTDSLNADERSILEKSLLNLANNYKSNDGYVWQNEKLVKLSGNYSHLAGPFRPGDSLHFFGPGQFDIHFLFEPGYQYQLSAKILRLEKKAIFPVDRHPVKLPKMESAQWILGDTILPSPVITYPAASLSRLRYLHFRFPDPYAGRKREIGQLRFTAVQDTVLRYVILYNAENPDSPWVVPGDLRTINHLPSGEYSLLLVDRSWKSAMLGHVVIKPHQAYCIHTNRAIYTKENALLDKWVTETLHPVPKPVQEDSGKRSDIAENLPDYEIGDVGITGKVIDLNGGHGIPGATVILKSSRTGTITRTNGGFALSHIRHGKCTLLVTAIGYISKQVPVEVPEEGSINITVTLAVSSQSLNDVVVVGYSVSAKRDMTYSFSTIQGEELSKTMADSPVIAMLMGKVAGVSVFSDGDPGSEYLINIRGIGSQGSGQHPLYVIDGIFYDEIPANVSQDMIKSMDVLQGEQATALYGQKGANGAVVITTRTRDLRNTFRDYAFWQPELFTDKNGEVRFSVEYPDNITGWQTYVLGMDNKRRMGKSYHFVKSFKPLTAQVSVPSFLIAGDTAEIIGKSFNYSNDAYSLRTHFTLDGLPEDDQDILLRPMESRIARAMLVAPLKDSLPARYTIRSNTGFTDEEERKIPILPKGSLETKGHFWVLDSDTTVNFQPSAGNESIACYAQNNTLSILLDEIEGLKKYPYYCMEQTASKLRGLLAEKEIRRKLDQKFNGDKDIRFLTDKLEKSQLFDGGWSWWENGRADFFITNYVIHALLPLRTGGMVETNVRNGLLWLQNQLPVLGREELLAALVTMSEAGHLIHYPAWLSKIPFDSLPIHQQWQFVKIMQMQQMDYSDELKKLMRKGIHGVLGSLHWGEENYRWYGDADATTVVAFEVLQKEKNHEPDLRAIVQYFLEQRSRGYWRNTVASSSIVAALLPYVLSANANFDQAAVLTITGDTSFSIKEYPFKLVMNTPYADEFHIRKSGGGITYLTFYQQTWNKNPQAVDTYFDIHTSFERNGQRIESLRSGEKIRMIVEVDAKKEADYVMIEIPTPAGCAYGSKAQDDWGMHKEFLKNKVMLFSEKMEVGKHRYEIDLESRYNGTFTVNPAKVSLMYFPTFYGRNSAQQIVIRPIVNSD